MNIIEIILKSKKEQTGMTAANFFTENNPHGYFDKPALSGYLTRHGQQNLEKFQSTLEFMNNGVPFNNLPAPTEDKQTGLPCIWLNPKLPKSNPKIKLFVEGRLAEFVEDYIYGRIQPNFTLEDLYNEVMKESEKQIAD